MAETTSIIASVGEWLRNNQATQCPKCGNSRFDVKIGIFEETQWMGVGLVEVGNGVQITCTDCGNVRQFLVD